MTEAPVERDIVALYQEVERLTGGMLSAAHQQDWDRLAALEAGCARCIDSIKGCPVPARLSEEARQKKFLLLKSILANDREIRKLAEPWMQQISHLLGSANAECRVRRSYGSNEA
ncbi:MAG: hypothetical protein RL404_2647 [Pseudomonadota bacterium]|jgi:flagellar protein FliT